MVNNPLIRPYFLGGVALGGVARIPLISGDFELPAFGGSNNSMQMPYIVVFMGKLSPRIPRLNTINTVRVHVR